MKIVTVLGTRPEIIRLSLVIPLLDSVSEHTLVHTGQNSDERLNDIFFDELGIRAPDVFLGATATGFAEQAAQIFTGIERVLNDVRPDRLLVLGDTNSGLSTIVAKRRGIPVYHMEAGNRCYDDRVPEEVNRRLIDHASSVLMPYTERSRANLLVEGIEGHRIYVTGNPIKQVLDRHASGIAARKVLPEYGVEARRYFLVTMHRAENVDDECRLRALLTALRRLQTEWKYPVICSLHPRTRFKMEQFGLGAVAGDVMFARPFGLFDFVALERDAFCILSDSGTVQEEACILGTPNVTIRDVTERPETVECGSNFLAGVDPDLICAGVRQVTVRRGTWLPPPEYVRPAVAETVVQIVTSERMAAHVNR